MRRTFPRPPGRRAPALHAPTLALLLAGAVAGPAQAAPTTAADKPVPADAAAAVAPDDNPRAAGGIAGLLLLPGLAAPPPAVAAAAPAVPATATPAPATASLVPSLSGDTVLQFLQQRGVLPSGEAAGGGAPALVRQWREAASDAVIAAMNFLGVPYRRGGNSAAEGFDCSGFTRHIFEHSLGLLLPRRADEQANAAGLAAVAREQLRPGDLVFFNTLQRAFSHVGIYIGDGRFIHSPRSGAVVRVEDMRQAYWAQRFDGARRADLRAEVRADRPADRTP